MHSTTHKWQSKQRYHPKSSRRHNAIEYTLKFSHKIFDLKKDANITRKRLAQPQKRDYLEGVKKSIVAMFQQYTYL